MERTNEGEKTLEIVNATALHRRRTLFEGLNFTIKKGEHWAITGESGSGKTALLKTLAGEYYISKGDVRHYFFEEYVRSHPVDSPFFTFRNLIAMVDVRHQFQTLSNTTNFYYQQRYNASDADDARTVGNYLENETERRGYWTRAIVERMFQLKPLLDKRLIQLSNGESKRLRIAAALLKNPVALLLDAPFAGLDVDMRDRLREILAEIARSGIHLVMTANPDEIPTAVTHVCALSSDGGIRTWLRDEFKPEFVSPARVEVADASKVGELWSRNPSPYQAIVKMRNVAVKYGDHTVFEGIDWEVRPGERWALSGANGSGKSMLLSLIYGDNPQAYANDIVLFDRKRGSGESIWEIKQKIGFMSPELYQYFPQDFTCLHAVESGYYDTMGLFRDIDREREDRALQWMKLLGAAGYSDAPLRDIPASGQRLCLLARALVKCPELLILDEPCQGMDRAQQEYFRSVVDAICEGSGATLIYVTHYQEELPGCITHRMAL